MTADLCQHRWRPGLHFVLHLKRRLVNAPGVITRTGRVACVPISSTRWRPSSYTNTTRPDIDFAVGLLGRFMANPTEEHWKTAKHRLRYLKGAKKTGIVYSRAVQFFMLKATPMLISLVIVPHGSLQVELRSRQQGEQSARETRSKASPPSLRLRPNLWRCRMQFEKFFDCAEWNRRQGRMAISELQYNALL